MMRWTTMATGRISAPKHRREHEGESGAVIHPLALGGGAVPRQDLEGDLRWSARQAAAWRGRK
jgi:hypothetical protein